MLDHRAGRVHVSDGNTVFSPTLVDGKLHLRPTVPLVDALAEGIDLAWVFCPLPALKPLTAARRLRRHGVPIVFAPTTFLGRDFATGSWFTARRTLRERVKPLATALLRTAWRRLATWFVCVSAEEAAQAGLPTARTILLPWPAPDTPLAAAISARDPARPAGDPDGPVILASRLAVHQKGVDRLCDWLRTHAPSLPRPAAVLATPDGDAGPQVRGAVDAGLLDWDRTHHGAELLPLLEGARGAILLSRWDGQPRILREAAMLGLPTISTVSCHFSELVELLGTGSVVPDDDPDALQAAFQQAQPGDARIARELLDRDAIGGFLMDVLTAIAAGETPSERSYYASRSRPRG